MKMTNPAVDSIADRLSCNAERSQLVVVDIQEKLGAVMPEKVLARVIRNTQLLLSTAGSLGIPVTVTEQYPKGLGATDARVTGSIPASAGRIQKTRFSCVGAAGFDTSTARPQIVLTGMESHICVLQTAMDLLGAGLQPYVVEDAVCSRKLENYENALRRLEQAGVVIITAESVVFEWLRDARHPQFKAVSAQVR
jgi:nicotinamidase-related amidase